MRREPSDPEIDEALRELAPRLDELRTAAPQRALLASTLLRAKSELRSVVAARTLPAGYSRELVRLVALALPAFAAVVAWNVFLLPRLPGVLGAWLPSPIALGLGLAYALGVAGWLALTAGSLPLLAHLRARQLTREAI